MNGSSFPGSIEGAAKPPVHTHVMATKITIAAIAIIVFFEDPSDILAGKFLSTITTAFSSVELK
jgi:hypothetical protein